MNKLVHKLTKVVFNGLAYLLCLLFLSSRALLSKTLILKR